MEHLPHKILLFRDGIYALFSWLSCSAVKWPRLCSVSPQEKGPQNIPQDGVSLDCSSQLHIQEDSSFLENRGWHNCLYLANSSFKIHSFHLFGYEIAARQQNRNHQWKFFLQEGRWFNWPWNWELLLRVSCPLSWEFKWKKQENRVLIVANPSTIFKNFTKNKRVHCQWHKFPVQREQQ